jgi:hypothetical protein
MDSMARFDYPSSSIASHQLQIIQHADLLQALSANSSLLEPTGLDQPVVNASKPTHQARYNSLLVLQFFPGGEIS